MRITLITGISGSGKSVALRALEDAGYFCVDNLPPPMIRQLVVLRSDGHDNALAIAIDARSADSLEGLRDDMQALRESGHIVQLLFLTASTDALIARFSETRRSHPLSHKIGATGDDSDRKTLVECIQAEREILENLDGLGHTIDTSHLSANRLRSWIRELISAHAAPLTLLFESFAFKRGVPLDADLVFDVRMLPNPHYDPLLRAQTGRDPAVIAFLAALPEVSDMQADIQAFVTKWLPAFKRDNRSYLTVAIGCTGGQHRSVYLVEQLATHFSRTEVILRRHRQLG